MEALDYGLDSDICHYTEYMLRLFEQLPKQYEELMNSCSSCVFDYGFEGGVEDKPISVDLTPTRTLTTQNNHIFMSIYSVYKLECLKLKHHINHFAIRMKLLIKANQFAYQELQKLQSA